MSKLFFHAQNKPNGKVWKGPGGLNLVGLTDGSGTRKTGFSIDIGTKGYNPIGSLSSSSPSDKITWFEDGWQGSISDHLMVAFSIVNARKPSASIRPLILFSSSNTELIKHDSSSNGIYNGYTSGILNDTELVNSFIWGYSEGGTDIEEAGITKEQVSDFIESFKGIQFPGITIKDVNVYGTKDFTSEQVPGEITLTFYSGDLNDTNQAVHLSSGLRKFVGYLDPVYPDGAWWEARAEGVIRPVNIQGSVNIKKYESLRSSFDSKGYLDLTLYVDLQNSTLEQWTTEG